MHGLTIETVDHRSPDIARSIHAVWMAAYALEARWIGVRRFEPLERTAESIRTSAEQFLAAFIDGTIIGVIGVERESVAPHDTLHIGSLVVMPTHLRRGVGRRLLQALIDTYPAHDLTVSTALRNTAALALYSRFGFIQGARQIVGAEQIEIVSLCRSASCRCFRANPNNAH